MLFARPNERRGRRRRRQHWFCAELMRAADYDHDADGLRWPQGIQFIRLRDAECLKVAGGLKRAAANLANLVRSLGRPRSKKAGRPGGGAPATFCAQLIWLSLANTIATMQQVAPLCSSASLANSRPANWPTVSLGPESETNEAKMTDDRKALRRACRSIWFQRAHALEKPDGQRACAIWK